jgi:iron complex outermembrane receptor protein
MALISFSQGIQDTIFHIDSVTVTVNQIFRKEKAGMKETRIDSSILLGKINHSLSEILAENTSVFIKNHGRGALATASFRGTAASHVQVDWNGININSPMTGMVDFSLIPVYVIDDLILKHGGASLSNHSGGLGGSISISNTVDWDNRFGLKYLQGIGSYSSFDEFLQVGVGTKKIQIKTRLYHNYSANDYSYINRGIGNIDPNTGQVSNPLDTNNNADYTKYGILQEVNFRPNSKNILSIKYWGQKAERTIPRATSYEGLDNSNLNNQDDNDHKLVADWKYYRKKSSLIIRCGYSQKSLDYNLKNHVPGKGPVLAINSESKANSYFNKVGYSLNLTNGFSFQSSLDLNYHDVNTFESVKKTGYVKDRLEISAFLAIQKSFYKHINVNFMMRQDWIDDSFVPFVPYIGFDFKPIKQTDFVLKGNISRNFHSPSLNDMYWQPGGNPDLLPEEGLSSEIGIEYQKNFKNHLLKTEITAYRSDINNWIIWIPNYKGYWEPRNIKRVLSRGIEFNITLNGKLGPIQYKTLAGYTFTPSTNYGNPMVWGDNSYGKQLVYVPLRSNNFMANIAYKKFYLIYQFNHYSERFTTSSNDFTRRDWLYPYFMNDIIIGKEITIKNVSLSAELKIYNLFNETYHSILYRPMPGRNYMLLLMMKI